MYNCGFANPMRLMILDLATQKWSKLGTDFNQFGFSEDAKSVYFDTE